MGEMVPGEIRTPVAVLNNGKVLIRVEHASDVPGPPTYTAELYDPVAGSFSAAANGASVLGWGKAAVLTDGQVLLEGGADSNGNFIFGQLYDPVTDTSHQLGENPVTASGVPIDRCCLYAESATSLSDGTVLIAGGNNVDFFRDPTATAALYNPTSHVISATGSMTVGRYYHQATPLRNGLVLISGGDGGCCQRILASTEFYDVSAGMFTLGDDMMVPRVEHTATLLTDGTVLISGGIGSYYPSWILASVELYTPVSH